MTPRTTMDPVFVWTENQSACSTTCGSGTRTVSFQCQNAADPDLANGGFGAPEPDAQCVSTVGPKPWGRTSACVSFSGCTFDWVKHPEDVSVVQIATNPHGPPGCGTHHRQIAPSCKQTKDTG